MYCPQMPDALPEDVVCKGHALLSGAAWQGDGDGVEVAKDPDDELMREDSEGIDGPDDGSELV